MTRHFPVHLFIICMLAIWPDVASAGQVVCLEKWRTVVPTALADINDDPAAHVSGHHVLVIPERIAKWWPSGYRPKLSSCYVALFAGAIEKGDYERFKDFLKHHYRALWSIHLVSRGGDVDEALKIGRLLRKYMLHVQAPSMRGPNDFMAYGHPPSADQPLCEGPTCVCASSCALIWFGSVQRDGTVGLHRPKFNDPQFGLLPQEEASRRYRYALQEISRYLEEMEVPRSMIEAMASTGSADIRWVEPPSEDHPLKQPPSHTEWINANCTAVTAEEYAALRTLSKRESASRRAGKSTHLTHADELLRRKQRERIECSSALEFSRRDLLPPP